MSSTWGTGDAHSGKDPDDITKYDHLLPPGASRMRQFDLALTERDARIKQLEADVSVAVELGEHLSLATELIDTLEAKITHLTNANAEERQRQDQVIDDLTKQNARLINANTELEGVNTELHDELAGMKSWRWIDSTYALQRDVYGHSLPMRPNTDELADYAQVNLFAAIDEITEMAGEIGWKPWASPRGWIRPQHVMKEAVDVLHFIANVLCAAGISDEEFWEAYRAKQATNTSRQELGYDGVSGKCPGCRRSYDDEIDCDPPSGTEPAYCTVKDTFVELEE